LIDRIFVSSTFCYWLVMEREMRSRGEEPNDEQIKYFNLLFRLTDQLVDWSIEFLFHRPCATFRLVMEREMRSRGEEPSDCGIEYFSL
jgi:hypothetical protein